MLDYVRLINFRIIIIIIIIIYEPICICDQDWVNFRSLVFQIWCSQGFQDAQTHSLTDGQTRIQYASDTVFSTVAQA